MQQPKTNVMRMLDKAAVDYTPYFYEAGGAIDGISVADKMHQPHETVFKTLVTQGASRAYHVFVIPVAEELDLKKAAKAAGEKSVAMIPVADINKITGYIRGGCSPLGMKKPFATVLHSSALSLQTLIVSGGKIGTQVQLAPQALAALANAQFADIIKESHGEA